MRYLASVLVLGAIACVAGCATELEPAPDDDAEAAEAATSVCAEEAAGSGAARDCHAREVDDVQGAYFRKVTSATRKAHAGVAGEGVLPRVELDPARWLSTPAALRSVQPPQKVFSFGSLDVPSVYMGGHAGSQEVDAGLAWSRVFLRDGSAAWTDDVVSGSDGGDPERRFTVQADGRVVSATGRVRTQGLTGLVEDWAFRPFWRVRAWNNPSVSSPDNRYFFPGQAFRMSVRVTARDELTLRIDGGADDRAPFSVTFVAAGFGRGTSQSFKRVNSIDLSQSLDGRRAGREGAPVLPTRSRVTGARWTRVDLLRADGSRGCKLACGASAVVGADLRGRYDSIFTLSGQNSAGAETIDIDPPDR